MTFDLFLNVNSFNFSLYSSVVTHDVFSVVTHDVFMHAMPPLPESTESI